jgi:polysaccharide pyruvyl transferase WcaK-like protein
MLTGEPLGGRRGTVSRSLSRRCLYLVGPAGFPNYGDELVAATWLRYLARTEPDAEVWLDCHSPGPAQLLLGELHPGLRFTDTLWRLCADAPSDDPWEAAAWVQAAVRHPGMAPRWDAGIELLGRADVVHVIGGGYVNSVWPRQVGLLAGAAAAALRSGGRAAMTGHGLVPLPDGAIELLRSLADRFDVVDVRDEPSARLVGRDVRHTCDDVFLELPKPPAGQATREFVLCVQSDMGRLDRSALAARVLGLLRAWDVRPDRLAVVEGIPRVDRMVYELLESELRGAEFVPFRDVWRGCLPVASGQTWISTRFHPHLLAAAAGASGVAVSVSPDYYAVKHRSLLDLGSRWTMVDAAGNDVPDRPDGGGFTAAALRSCRDAKLAVAEKIYRRKPPPSPKVAGNRAARRLSCWLHIA